MKAAEQVDAAEIAVRHALDVDVRTPDDMKLAIARLGAAVTAVVSAHGAILDAARAHGADERADKAEVDGMLAELAQLWSARFGKAGADVTIESPALLAVQWDAVDHVDTELIELDARAHALLDAWTDRTEAWAELAALERRSRAAMATVVERQRELRARFSAAEAAMPTLLVLEKLRDELITVLQAAASPQGAPDELIGTSRRRCGAALVELAALSRDHGAVPGFGERLDRLGEAFRLLREGLSSV